MHMNGIHFGKFQIYLQELDDVSQQVTDERSLTVFIRRWNPSTMTLGPFNEITIYGKFGSNSGFFCQQIYQIIRRSFVLSLHALEKDNMKSVLSQHSGIPEENIEFAKVNFLNYIFRKTDSFIKFYIKLEF